MKSLRRLKEFVESINPPTSGELIVTVAVGAPILVLLACLFSAMLLPGYEYPD